MKCLKNVLKVSFEKKVENIDTKQSNKRNNKNSKSKKTRLSHEIRRHK